ncbi:hypothetical protein [Umezawaea sp. Da 62-37]|uniref:hypothetical protein n=1 Tax=Umezawaea sp. Da 62-37 TaxID=3075927 RepID=UPI0028F74658|nr:hypothetical protein [Umezawaea sp. Da 62-37]WNV86076.1 hypothetical protein RM788_49525 [Umezawaea sp. Da 62-37]
MEQSSGSAVVVGSKDELGGLLRRITAVTRAVSDDLRKPVDDEAARRLTAELDEMAVAVRDLPLRRPWTGIVRTVDETAGDVLAAVRDLLEPAEDQEQRHLDRLPLRVAELEAAQALLDADTTSDLDALTSFSELASRVTGSTDPLVWDDRGWSAIETAIGEPLPRLTGLGVQLLVLALPARVVFDEVSFDDAVRTSYAAFRSSPDRLAALLGDPHVRADLAEAHDHLMSGRLVTAALRAASHPEDTALPDLARDLADGLGRRLATALRAVRTDTPYGTLRAEVDDAPAADVDVRDPLDHHIAGIEAVHAAYIGLIVAAARSRADLSDPRGLDLLGLDAARTTEVGLRIWGWQVDSVSLDDTSLTVEATLPLDAKVVTAIGVIAPYLPEGVSTVALTLTGPDDRRHHLEGPLAPWNAYSTPDSDKTVALADVLGSLVFDGAPAMPRAVHRRLVATWAATGMKQDPPVAVPRLRRLRESARLVGDDELASAVTGVITVVRNGLQKVMLDPKSAKDLPLLIGWARTPAPDPAAFADTLGALAILQSTPTQSAPAQSAPAQEAPVQDTPAQDVPASDQT